MIYVYTSILNGWDDLRPLNIPADPNVRYVCFTNVPNLPQVGPWQYRPLYEVGPACRTARVPKILPHLMLPDDAEYSIYLDGNLHLKKQPAQMIVELLGAHHWAMHRHPCRACIYDEAECIVFSDSMDGWRKQRPARAIEVVGETERYRKAGYPERAGLWACGMIVRRHTPEVAKLNEHWWSLYSTGGERDQLSFPVARHAEGLDVNTIDAVISDQSPYVSFTLHAAWKDRPENQMFHPERSRIREKLQRLGAVTGSSCDVRFPEF